MADVFNNPSNDYISPGLAPCSNVPDGESGDFKFIDDGAGVIVGTEIVQFMDLSDINIHLTEWSGKKQTIQSGEVIYVPGLDKGLLNKKQVFEIPSNINETNQKYYFIIDASISYYSNFRYYNINIEASSNYSLNIGIGDALNIALDNNGIKTIASYDPSEFTFTGSQEGYEFNISNIELTTIDVSTDATSPFPDTQTYVLSEDTSSGLPSSKYPNGAMLGYMIKVRYPSDESYKDYWLYTNHVESPYTVYIQADLSLGDTSVYYEKISKNVEVGMSGEGNETTLSAADYLDYINSNSLWFKIGQFASRFSAPDVITSQEKNLIGGFYLYNPHNFDAIVDYMVLNRKEI